MIPEIFAPGLVSSGAHDMDITFTPDGNEMFFTRSGPDWFRAILTLRRSDGRWTEPRVAPFPDIHSMTYPFLSPDGNTLYLDSEGDIYRSERTNGGWSSPVRLTSTINTDQREGFVSAALNGNLYFMARYESAASGSDIYRSEYIDGGYGEVCRLSGSVNSEFNEFHPFISPDEGYILFDSQRPDGFGSNDLYISFRKQDGTWTEARNMGEPINSAMSDMRPYVTPDGKYLFFSSTRGGPGSVTEDRNLSYDEFMTRIEGPGNGSQDIYWVSAAVIERFRP